MNTRRERRFERPRRRTAFPAVGFLRPLHRRAAEDAAWRERIRQEPALRREYRSGLLLQLCVTGALVLSCVVLLVQSLSLIARFQKIATLSSFAWFLPILIAGLGLVALRRFLRLASELRALGRDPR